MALSAGSGHRLAQQTHCAAKPWQWAGVLGAFSLPLAGWLGQRIGLVNTMVFTHIPASLCLMAAALVPDEFRRFNPTEPANAALQVAQDGRWWGENYARVNADYIDMVTG